MFSLRRSEGSRIGEVPSLDRDMDYGDASRDVYVTAAPCARGMIQGGFNPKTCRISAGFWAPPLSKVGSGNDCRRRHPPQLKRGMRRPSEMGVVEHPLHHQTKKRPEIRALSANKLGLLGLQVEIHEEFVRMRTQTKGVVLLLFHLDPVTDEVLVKDIAFEQEFMIRFQGVQCAG